MANLSVSFDPMQAVIPVGVPYAQVIEDMRAVFRHELAHYISLAASAGANPALGEDPLTVREAATLLDVTVQTIHSWKKIGLLKYYKLGSRTYITRADVLAAMSGHQRSAKAGKGKTRG